MNVQPLFNLMVEKRASDLFLTCFAPVKIKIDGNFLVAARIETSYTPAVGWLATHKVGDLSKETTAIQMEEEMFLRPRIGNNIEVKGSCS